MADDTLEIKVDVDTNDANAKFDQLDKELGKVTESSGLASEAASFFSTSTGKLAAALGAATLTLGAVTAAYAGLITIAERGDAVLDVSSAFEELTAKAGAASDVLLGDLRLATEGAIDNLKLMEIANEGLTKGLKPEVFAAVAQAAQQYADKTGGDAAQALDTFVTAITKGNEKQLEQLGLLSEGKIKLQAFDRATSELNNQQLGLYGTYLQVKTAITNAYDRVAVAVEQSKALRDITLLMGKVVVAVTNKLVDFAKGLIQLADKAFKRIQDEIENFVRGLRVLQVVMRQISEGYVDFDNAAQEVEITLQRDLKVALRDSKTSTEQLDDSLGTVSDTLTFDVPKGADDTASALKKVADEASKTADTFENAFNHIVDELGGDAGIIRISDEFEEFKWEELGRDAGKKTAKGFGEGLGGDSAFGGGQFSDLFGDGFKQYAGLFSQLASSLGDTLDSDASGEDKLKAGHQAAKRAVAAFFTFGISELVIQAIGVDLFSELEKFDPTYQIIEALFGEDKQVSARKALDKKFAELFDAAGLQVVIDGQLKQLHDLDFGGPGGFDTGEFDDALLASADNIKGAFIGVGEAMNALLPTGESLGGQLAAVFFNNVGGSLNNLGLLIQSTGQTAEQMTGALVAAAKKGELSFLETQSAINGVNKAMEDGIPDGVGFAVEAFENLFAAGSKGGLATIDALQDIGFEMLELGQDTLPELEQMLVSSGKFTQDQIEGLFAALAESGIDSMTELSNATDEQLIAILSNLQANDILTEAEEQAESLIDKINNIPKEKDITINVKANYENGAQEVINAVSSGSTRQIGEGRVQ
jgi:hypothetical protein